jgi:hypothetical protein
MQLDTKIKFGQDHNIHGILVVSILYWSFLWIEDIRGTLCEQGFFADYHLFSLLCGCGQLLVTETNKYYNQYLDTLGRDSECSRLLT